MKFLKVAAICVSLGTGFSLYAQPREKQAEPAKQEKAAQPQRVQQPKQQAQPQQRAQQPAQRVQPQQQPKQQAQPQQRAQQPARVQPQQQRAQQPARVQPQQQQRAQQPAREAPQQRAGGQPARQVASVRNAGGYAPPQRSTQQAQAWQQRGGWRQQGGGWQGGATFQQDRASNWASEHRTWGQRGGYGGYFIPQASFGLYFGVGHFFRIGVQPFIVGGYPEFRYGGYTFMMVDPWPADWSPDWYQTDELYVGYDNGYYLYDQNHPGEAVAIAVVM